MAKRPLDPNVLAKLIVDMSTGKVPNDSAILLQPTAPATEARRTGPEGREGLREEALRAELRSKIARRAAVVRWLKKF